MIEKTVCCSCFSPKCAQKQKLKLTGIDVKSIRNKLPKYSRSNNRIMKTIIEKHDGKKPRAVLVLAQNVRKTETKTKWNRREEYSN